MPCPPPRASGHPAYFPRVAHRPGCPLWAHGPTGAYGVFACRQRKPWPRETADLHAEMPESTFPGNSQRLPLERSRRCCGCTPVAPNPEAIEQQERPALAHHRAAICGISPVGPPRQNVARSLRAPHRAPGCRCRFQSAGGRTRKAGYRGAVGGLLGSLAPPRARCGQRAHRVRHDFAPKTQIGFAALHRTPP